MYGQDLIKAFSCGSKPSGTINRQAIKSMQEVGYDLSVHESKGVNQVPDLVYDLVVTMGCGDGCPNVRALQRIDWSIPDPKQMNDLEFSEVRDLLLDQVLELISH